MIVSNADAGKLMRRKRRKSKAVSGGMTCRCGRYSSSTSALMITAMATMTINARVVVSKMLSSGSERHVLGPPPADPVRDDQPRQRERGEHRGEDADAKRDGKAAHRPGADAEQHRGRDEGRDVGVENRGKRAREARVDRGDWRPAGAHLL